MTELASWPEWADGIQALKLGFVDSGVDLSWQRSGAQPCEWLAAWLEARVASLSSVELDGAETQAVLVLARIPVDDDPDGVVGGDSPVSRFGYSAWPEPPDGRAVTLGLLLQEGIDQLTRADVA